VRFRLRVKTPKGVLYQDFEGTLERVLERLADLATVVPKEATWEGTEWRQR
jgi:hypothetical protein